MVARYEVDLPFVDCTTYASIKRFKEAQVDRAKITLQPIGFAFVVLTANRTIAEAFQFAFDGSKLRRISN